DLSNLIAKGTETYQWRYWRPVIDDSEDHRTFVSCLWNDSTENNFFQMLWKTIQKKIPSLQDFYCYRIIANGTVKGQNILWHRDHGDKTVLYFPLAWQPHWDGSTYFRVGISEEEIKYRQNRLVIFDTAVKHRVSGPKVDNVLRVSIAFNLRIKT